MRFKTQWVLGLAVSLGGLAGCASSRHSVNLDPAVVEAAVDPSTFPSDYAEPQTREQADPFRVSHPRVEDYVDRFQTDLRGFFSGALSRSGKYVPRMISILEKEGVPTELVYLPLIESGYRTRAVSPAGAVGPWQFIPGTGRRYGLRIDSYVDERRDPVKSTRAAARYLRDLHDMFGDWHLSLAAYNTGEGRISRILNSGLADDFWEMRDNGYLYRETQEYVPEFLAAVQIAENPEAHGFESPEMENVQYDIVALKSSMQLATIARLAGTSADEIRDLNPALHRGMVPPQGYSVRLPKGSKDMFQLALGSYEEEMRNLAVRRAEEARVRAAECRSKGKNCNKRGKTVVATAANKRTIALAKGRGTVKTAKAARAASVKVASASRANVTRKPAATKAVSKAVASRATASKTKSVRKATAPRKPATIVTASRKAGRRVVD